jgi:hypothetical protein
MAEEYNYSKVRK